MKKFIFIVLALSFSAVGAQTKKKTKRKAKPKTTVAAKPIVEAEPVVEMPVENAGGGEEQDLCLTWQKQLYFKLFKLSIFAMDRHIPLNLP